MKKSIKSILAKATAIALAFSLVGITPSTSSDAASKKLTVTKKVTVNVGKTKKVKVTSKKKVKKTKWTLTKAGKKVVKLSKKKKKSVKVKGLKAGKATLTAKIKVGKKTYKKKCKITVKAASTDVTVTAAPTATPTGGSNSGNNSSKNDGSSDSTSDTVTEFTSNTGATLTVDESQTKSVAITALNETAATSDDKRSTADDYHSDLYYTSKDGSVTFTSTSDYNNGVSYYINTLEDESLLKDTGAESGATKSYNSGTVNISEYDYIRIKVTTEGQFNLRFFTNDTITSFWEKSSTEFYEMNQGNDTPDDEYMVYDPDNAGMVREEDSDKIGDRTPAGHETRTIFMPVKRLINNGLSDISAIMIGLQKSGDEMTVHAIDFVKVNYDTEATGITVSGDTSLANGKVTSLTATVTPDDATRKIVKWSSSDESLATVNSKGQVTAANSSSGNVTITATATDGSGVYGSIDLAIGEAVASVVKSIDMDLTDSNIVAGVNAYGQTGVSATVNSDGTISYTSTMNTLDISAYLTANNIDLSDYSSIAVDFEYQDASGATVTTNNGCLKCALVTSAKMDGYSTGCYGGYKDTAFEIDLTAIAAADLAEVAGFNFQWNNIDKTTAETLVIKSIKLVAKPVMIDLTDSNIVADVNAYGQTGVSATVNSDGTISYTSTMNTLDISAYLTANNIDLSDYSSIAVDFEYQDASGATVTTNNGCLKCALVTSAKMDGYSTGCYGGYKDTAFEIDLTAIAVADLAEVAGFNFQWNNIDKTTAETLIIKSIALQA